MNFARHQAQADRAARRLVTMHALAAISVVIAIDALATLLWHLVFGAGTATPRFFHATNIGVVGATIAGGAWLETARLRDDGAIVARRLGASAVDPTTDPLHRRLQNLLEELAIAARIGVPRAFVIEDEASINALTAGLDRNRAVVVVTRGALARLTREELQGVLAHEFSHVVSGDVRLNTRLVGLNHGLWWVALLGRSMLSNALSRGRPGPGGPLGLVAALPMATVGAIVAACGAIGEFAARAVQAAVGRQREYHADAQAVAFTRSRDGLGGALRKVAGETDMAGRRHRPYWRNVAPLWLVAGGDARRWFDTHPPLHERLHRLYGRSVEPIQPRELAEAERREPELPAIEYAIARPLDASGDEPDAATIAAFARREARRKDRAAQAPASGPAGAPTRWLDTVPVDRSAPGAAPDATPDARGRPGAGAADRAFDDSRRATASTRLLQATREPAGAAALVIALIAASSQSAPRWGAGWSSAAGRHAALRESLGMLPPDAVRTLRWPLMELAIARLRPLSRPSRDALLETARAMVDADRVVTLGEWIYFGLLRRRLAPMTQRLRLPILADPADARAVRVLFAMVARGAQVNEAKAERAANAAIRSLDLVPIGGTPGALTLDALEHAMGRAACLPPLARPLLVRQLVAILPADAGTEVRDFLRLLCVAIDCPPPRLPPRGRGSRETPAEALADADA